MSVRSITAPLRKLLIITGAGEGNRTLVSVVVRSGKTSRENHGSPGNAVDAVTGELRRSFAVTGSSADGRNTVLSPAGRWLAVASPSRRGVDIHDFATGELRYTLPDREGTVYWLAWHPKEPRLAIARDNGDIAIWDLAKIDRQLTELGLGFALATAESQPTQENP